MKAIVVSQERFDELFVNTSRDYELESSKTGSQETKEVIRSLRYKLWVLKEALEKS